MIWGYSHFRKPPTQYHKQLPWLGKHTTHKDDDGMGLVYGIGFTTKIEKHWEITKPLSQARHLRPQSLRARFGVDNANNGPLVKDDGHEILESGLKFWDKHKYRAAPTHCREMIANSWGEIGHVTSLSTQFPPCRSWGLAATLHINK